MENEIWKPINGYEGLYEVSNLGRIKSLPKVTNSVVPNKYNSERILKLCYDKKGYLMVWLFKDKKRKTCKVHRLVGEAFVSNDENKPEIDHINGVKDDNRAENLRWVTSKENFHNPITYKRNSESKTGELNHKSRSVIQLTMGNEFVKEWSCMQDIYREHGFSHSHTVQCCKGERKHAYGYKWKYKDK